MPRKFASINNGHRSHAVQAIGPAADLLRRAGLHAFAKATAGGAKGPRCILSKDALGFAVVLSVSLSLSWPATAQVPAPAQQSAVVATNNAILLEGIRQYDGAHYPEAVAAFSKVIEALNPADPAQRDLLAKSYEYRARSRFVQRDAAGTEADFVLLLKLRPSYEPAADISPRVKTTFLDIKKRTIGDINVQLTPPGDILIDETPYPVGAGGRTISLLAGEHTIAAKRPAYRTVEQKIPLNAGETVPLAITLERISATYAVRTVPDGVTVTFDGVLKGVTRAGADRRDVSDPLVIPDLTAGTYLTRFQRECYKPAERSLTISELTDIDNRDPIRLEPAVAKLNLRVSEPGATIYLDGASKGASPSEVASICEGEHLLEVRSQHGRFIDRRYWRTGDSETLNAVLRPAFAIVVNAPPSGVSPTEFRRIVENGLSGAKGALIFTPREEELVASQKQDDINLDFFHATSAAAVLRRRETGERVAGRLAVQGIAAIESSGRPDSVQLSLLAAGSTEPEVVTFDLNDASSRAAAVAALTADVPPITRVSIDAFLIDVASIQGAVVARASQELGLAPGEVVVDVGGAAVSSVADVQEKLNGKQGQTLTLGVRQPSGASKMVSVTPKLVPDTIPMADKHLLYNGILLRLEQLLREAKTPVDAIASRLNLAIVEMRLGRWGEAARDLEQLRLPEGPGVSGGTISYLLGICYEALGRRADATSSFTTASKSEAMLSMRGPRTAALAQEKLQGGGAR
jgi:hypothetical protein